MTVSNRVAYVRGVIVALSLLMGSSPSFGAERWHTSQVKVLYPLGNGNFVIMLAQDSAYCPNLESPRKYYRVNIGEAGVTAEGAKQMYASTLAALTSGSTIAIAFDDATSYCYVNRMQINAP